VDALAACFPAGTLSGAPKVHPLQIIEDWSQQGAASMAGPFSMPTSAEIWIPA